MRSFANGIPTRLGVEARKGYGDKNTFSCCGFEFGIGNFESAKNADING